MNYRNLIAVAALAVALPAAAQEVTLKIAHFLPSAAPTQQKVLQPWCDEMGKQSNGRIKCQFYPAMQLGGTPAQLVDQVKNGVADVVWTGPGYSAGRFPVHTAKKEIVGLTGFAGMKLRTSTRVGAKTLAALGGSPVAMPPAQVTEAIAKGVVDGSLGAWELVFPTKLSEVTKFHAQPAAGVAHPTATVLTVLMNKAKYDGLPADLKAIVDKTTGEVMVGKFGAMFDDFAADTRKRIAAQGNKITTFSATQVAAMKQATASVEDEWAKQVGEKGLDGKKLIASARELTGTNK
ncbi:MAG: dctP [Rhodocyclaceae bacterium]|nr:MAG: dctP [Rhodocyclaceae bacterium]